MEMKIPSVVADGNKERIGPLIETSSNQKVKGQAEKGLITAGLQTTFRKRAVKHAYPKWSRTLGESWRAVSKREWRGENSGEQLRSAKQIFFWGAGFFWLK